jgi:methionyl-tRNA synthetase
MLGLGERFWDESANPVLPAEFKKVEILFHKIEQERIDAEVARLGKEPQAQAPSASLGQMAGGSSTAAKPAAKEEKKMEITFDEFKKLDLRIALVTAVSKVEGADKLLRIDVDLGTEKRQIIAGIAPWYPPETLVGKKIVLVANLAPAKIRGNVSHGMLLAAEGDGQVVVLTPDKDVPAGSMVR